MLGDLVDVEVLGGNERDIEVPLLLADLAIIFDHAAGKIIEGMKWNVKAY